MSYPGEEGKNVFFPTSCEFPRALCAPHGNHDVCVGGRWGMSVGKESGQGGFQGTVSKWHG